MRTVERLLLGIVASISVVRLPGLVAAEGIRVSGEVEVGGQPVSTDPDASDSSKFGKLAEYRDIADGGVLPSARVDLLDTAKGWFAEFRAEDPLAVRGHDPFQEDQRYHLRFGKFGLYEIDMQWDRIPHVFSNQARTLFSQEGDGDLRLADSVQSAVQTVPDLLEGFLGSARRFDLGMRQDTGSFRFRYTPGSGGIALLAS